MDISDDTLLDALAPDENPDDVADALDLAFRFLDGEGIPLTTPQKTALVLAVMFAYKNESDTWDHAIDDDFYEDPGWKNAARLLRKHLSDRDDDSEDEDFGD